jgi:hypothetical protein
MDLSITLLHMAFPLHGLTTCTPLASTTSTTNLTCGPDPFKICFAELTVNALNDWTALGFLRPYCNGMAGGALRTMILFAFNTLCRRTMTGRVDLAFRISSGSRLVPPLFFKSLLDLCCGPLPPSPDQPSLPASERAEYSYSAIPCWLGGRIKGDRY